ncbi:SRPBCC domain-containing protein [uncultured Marivirga sp.]|uniref:SRPBCC domain-containing protein n=1 Tax=uncultured Marivirga sp. TaxID=1123707 RepID=UPI0030EE4EE9|tara:strand:+ start:1682 stop:2089 length:408 start_codon:yes stop_codon:yes gene_type:complete
MTITVEITIQSTIDKVWNHWTKPEHIINWNFASDEWCCPSATNDLRSGREFVWRMEAKDGSVGFDYKGIYDQIEKEKSISYKMTDGRKVIINFLAEGDSIKLTESFEAEGTNSDEQQRAGWQAILVNFKNYVESQ